MTRNAIMWPIISASILIQGCNFLGVNQVIIKNRTDQKITDVMVSIAGKTKDVGEIPAQKSKSVRQIAHKDGSVKLTFLRNGLKVEKNFSYVTPGVSVKCVVTIAAADVVEKCQY